MRSITLVIIALAIAACSSESNPSATTQGDPKPASPPVAQPPPKSIEVVAVFAQPKIQELSCEATREIVKSRIDEGKQVGDELLLGLGACDKRIEANDKDGIVIAVPQEDGKYFYDIIPKKTAQKATDVCKAGAAVGATLIAAGEENIAITLYGPGGRACDELLSMALRDNPMLIIDPVGAIAINETQRVGKKALRGLKLYDNYQEATADLEDVAKRLHASANKDIVQVKEWVAAKPDRALVYASNPMIGPIYEDRVRIGREMERVPDNVEKGGQCVIDVLRGKKC